jgi:purine-binding chemotaxis protein CheW
MTERDGHHVPGRAPERAASLVCRVATRSCAIPLGAVIETMRPLPIEPIAGAPAFIAGLAIIRGEPVPVVDVARLLDPDPDPGRPGRATRFVTLRTAPRPIALAVDAVIGVHAFAPEQLSALPALAGAVASDAITAIGALDARLVVVLEAARLVPPAVFELVERAS